jgi:hypothetical protein
LTFILRVDMALTDPGCPLFPLTDHHHNFGAANTTFFRHALLQESSFAPLWRVLHGWSPWHGLVRGRGWRANAYTDPPPMTRLDTLKLYAKNKLPEQFPLTFLHPDPPIPADGSPPAYEAYRTRFMAILPGEIARLRWERRGVFPRPRRMDPAEAWPRMGGPVMAGERWTPLCAMDEILIGEMVRRKIRVESWIWGAVAGGNVPAWVAEKIQTKRAEKGE